MTDILPPVGKKCKYTGFKQNCRDLVCKGVCTDNWARVSGKNPLTGVEEDRFGCVSEWTYVLAAEAARNANSGNAATLTLRDMIFDPEIRERELTKANDMKLIEAKQ